MTMNYKKNDVKNSSRNKKYIELETKIFEAIRRDYRLKDISFPFAILEKNDDTIILGSNEKVVGKYDYNGNLRLVLQETIGSILDNRYIEVQVQIAEKDFLLTVQRIKQYQAKQQEDEKSLIDVNAQKAEGKCNLIPFPIKENKVRSDLSVERHAIFAANTFKADFRCYERSLKDQQTGENFTLKIEVGDRKIKGLGVLKQKHQEAFYKLSQIWSQQNYYLEEEKEKNTVLGSIELSIYDLVQKLRGDDAGHHYQSAMQLLKEMAMIRVCIKKINLDDDTCDMKEFTLLSYGLDATRFNETTLKTKPGGISKVNIRFSKFVTDNFLKKNIKALMLGPYLSLEDKGRKGVAQLLYTMLDYELSTKEKFNISLKNLYSRLGLAEYKYKSDRKRKLEPAVEQLKKQKILDGEYEIEAYFIESEDKEDWIFIARRNPTK